MNPKKQLVIRLFTAIFLAVPCVASSSFGPPDTNCNPAVDTPSAGGCTWYNFYAHTNNTITGGSSFANYYVAALDPPWTITTSVNTDFRVLDGGHQGDTFTVYDNGSSIGSTSATSINANHGCASDPTGEGTDPAACWNDLLMSRGTFLLLPGNHSITVTWDQRVPGGDTTLQWFEIGNAPVVSGVPEPGTLLLMGSGALLLGLRAARRKRGRTSAV